MKLESPHNQQLSATIEAPIGEPGQGECTLLEAGPAADSGDQMQSVPATAAFDCDRYLHHGFFWRAEHQPDATALICDTECITYGELASQAQQVATELVALGCLPGEIVAIEATRSAATVAGLFGILQAGAAYLPVDPSWPQSRAQFVLDDCGVRFAVAPSQSPLASQVGGSVDPSRGKVASEGPGPAVPPGGESDLAYVIFTSGSTGVPKGVMITHFAAMNTVRDISDRFAVCECDRVLAISSFTFDLSVYDLFGVLGAGGTIVLPTDSQARDPAAWSRLIREQDVTLWNSVPALMEVLLSYLLASDEKLGSSLRLVMLSGDWISVTLPNRLWSISPDLEIISLGGATEVSIWSIVYPIREVDPSWPSIPYGKPLANQHFYILDEQGEHCEAGQTGELYIGGVGVAAGYCNRAALTAERFLPDVESGVPLAKMYRTGDFGRSLPDGNIEFLGRIDQQTKINGHRIELAEIESRLAQCAEVSQCAVSPVGDTPETRRLVAHVVPRNGAIDQTAIRTYLQTHLPTSMIPGSIIAVPSLPMNSNGKVDRAKLKTMQDCEATSSLLFDGNHPAKDEASEHLIDRVSAIWREVLHLPYVDPNENFFDLGGDSLSAALLFIRLQDEFENAPSLSELLEHPTIAELTGLLGSLSAPKKRLVIRMQPNGDRCPLFCFPGADGQLLVFRHLADKIGDDQPIYGVEPCGLEGLEPDRTIEEIAARSVREVRRVQPLGPYRLAGFSAGGVIAFEMARQLQQMGEHISLLLLVDSFAGLPPAVSPLRRLSFHLRHLASLSWREWGPHLSERAKVAWIKMRGRLLRVPADRRWAQAFKLSPHATRVALATLESLRTYELKPSPVNAVLLRASIQPHLGPYDDDLGWKSLCDSGFRVFEVPGTHLDCLAPRHIESLARTVRELLEDCPP